jgi:hypothetical protein
MFRERMGIAQHWPTPQELCGAKARIREQRQPSTTLPAAYQRHRDGDDAVAARANGATSQARYAMYWGTEGTTDPSRGKAKAADCRCAGG